MKNERKDTYLRSAVIAHMTECLAHGSQPFTIYDDFEIVYSNQSNRNMITRGVMPYQDEIDEANRLEAARPSGSGPLKAGAGQ